MTRVLIAAFDGLLPQQVGPGLTPNIHALAQAGVTFSRNHAVYPTVTRANSAAMVTGCYPGKHGIPANRAVFPDVNPAAITEVLQPELDAIAANPGTPVLFVPTIGELLAANGMTHVSVVGGTTGNAYVHFPRAAAAGRGGVINHGFSLPAELGIAERGMLGPWPEAAVPSIGRVRRVAESAVRFVIPEINPELLFVWFPEPDVSNHSCGIGSAQSDEALREADAGLGRILGALRAQGDEPDVFVISDHGYSTISHVVDVFGSLQEAGFAVNSGEGSVVAANNGSSILLNYPGASEKQVASLACWLLKQSWAGAVFCSLPQAEDLGLLPASVARISGLRAPHFTVSMNWSEVQTANGYRGQVSNHGPYPVGAGTHGSASPHDIRNTLIASGPSFKQATVSAMPSGNVDLTPTVLKLLGLSAPAHMDGRALEEGLRGGPEGRNLSVEEGEVSAKFETDEVCGVQTAQMVSAAGRSYMQSARLARTR